MYPFSSKRYLLVRLIPAVVCLYLSEALAETWQSLPPPPSSTGNFDNLNYMLTVVVNGRESEEAVLVEFRNGHYLLQADDLVRAGFPQQKLDVSRVDVSAMPELEVEYDQQHQRLLLTVPINWLPQQAIQGGRQRQPYPAQSSPGALINYDSYLSRTPLGGSHLAVWNEFRLFGDKGQFVSNGVWQQRLNTTTYSTVNYVRYDTRWNTQNDSDARSWYMGDVISDAQIWSNSVRVGGIQIKRDFSLRPDLVTYPLPAFVGQAAIPSTVDLYIDGYKTSSHTVQPGPFSLTNIPFINGAGEAVITTTDKLGRQITTTLPFYVASELLAPGLSEYSFTGGVFRENYGINNFEYGATALSGSYRYGAFNWLTLEAHAENAASMLLAGGGARLKAGTYGVLNGAFVQSHSPGNAGNLISWGYQYHTRIFSLSTQHQQRSGRYCDLALYRVYKEHRDSSSFGSNRRSAQYSASVSFKEYGNLAAAFIDIQENSGAVNQLLNLSWSKNLWRGSNIYLSASQQLQQKSWAGLISLTIPFGESHHASLSIERGQQGSSAQRTWLSRSMPPDGGLAWNASWAHMSNNDDYHEGGLNWQTKKINMASGFYGTDKTPVMWAELSGALVMMNGGLYAANTINDAFVLVKTDYPGVPVRYENQLMGKTDSHGYLLISNIGSYYPAKYVIDTLDLPANLAVPATEQRLSVKRNSGHLLHFKVQSLQAASVIILDQYGQPLPVSTQIRRKGQATEYIGWDGLTWMDNLTAENSITAFTPDGRRCETRLNIAGGQVNALKVYGPLICPLPAAVEQGKGVTSGN